MPPRRFTANHSVSYPVFEVADDLASLRVKGTPDISRTARLALTAALGGHRQCRTGQGNASIQKRWVSVLGTSVGNAMNNEAFYRQYRLMRSRRCPPLPGIFNSNPVDVLAREFGTNGPCQTVVNACTSGTDAMGLGALWIQSGLCDIVLAGGADELCHVTYNGFISLMITDDSPCKPFDLDRKGLNLGEGAAMLVLESEKSRQGQGKSFPGFCPGVWGLLRCLSPDRPSSPGPWSKTGD